MEPTRIGLVHPGEMGAALGGQFQLNGAELFWASVGRGAETRARAEQSQFIDLGDIDALRQSCDVIFSVCPPAFAVEVAESLAGFTGTYVDANAIAPSTTRDVAEIIEESGGSFVDGGVVGSPPLVKGAVRVYLSGSRAGEIAHLFDQTPVECRVVEGGIGAASAVKMAYAAWTKGTSAMILAIRALAQLEGVEQDLLEEWSTSQPQLEQRSQRAADSAANKGWRWVGEMEEIAKSFAARGLPSGFHLAAAEIYSYLPRRTESVRADDSLADVLGALTQPARSAAEPTI